jgi:hypothetical protein
VKPRPLPEEFEEFDDHVQALRKQIQNGADANAIGRSLAPLYLDSIARIQAYSHQLDAALGYELFLSDQTLEENLPRVNTALRIFRQLNDMLREQIDGLLSCFGGSQVAAVQQLVKWAEGNPSRQELLDKYFAAVIELAKPSRRKK